MDPECPKVGVLPVAEYPHTPELNPSFGCTVVAMGVYRGQESPDLNGIHFNSDFCSGRIWGVAPGDDGSWQMQELLDTTLFATGAGESESGELYLTNCFCGYAEPTGSVSRDGALWKLVQADMVPEGAETAPLEGEAGPEATPPGGAGEGIASPDAGTPAAAETPTTEAAAETGTVQLEAFDIGWRTADQPGPEVALTVAPGTTIDIINAGAAGHNFDAPDLGIFVDLPPGGSGQAVIPLDAQPGTYQFICNIPGHAPAGMVGTLTIQ
jgi:plastocyanin